MKWNSFSFLVGLSSLNFLTNETHIISQLLSAIAVLALIILLRRVLFKPKTYQLISSVLSSLMLGLIFASSCAYWWLTNSSQLVSHPQVVNVSGVICSIPRQLNKYSSNSSNSSNQSRLQTLKFDFCISTFDNNELSVIQKNKLKLNYYRVSSTQAESLTAGSSWQFQVKLKPIHGRLNPAGFDYEKWLVSQGFIGTGYVRTSTFLGYKTNLVDLYHQARQQIYAAVYKANKNDTTRGVILALAMGERGGIEPHQWQSIIDSGTAHLLAISGLHIGIAALWGYYCFLLLLTRISFVTRRFSAQRVAEIMSLVSAIIITLISGLGYPSQRALIMLSVFLLCRWSGRQLALGDILAISVIIISIIQPFAVMSVSFWLSVYAVAVIAFVVSFRQPTNGRWVKLKDWLRVNWLLFIGLVPISWWVFGKFAVVGFVANVLLIPLTTFITAPIIYLGLLSLGIHNIVAEWFFLLADYCISLTLWLQYWLALLNQSIPLASLNVYSLLAICLAVSLWLLPAKFPFRSLSYGCFVLVFLTTLDNPSLQRFKMVLFDVGQGLAISIKVADKQLIYDTAYGTYAPNNNLENHPKNKRTTEYAVADSTLVPYLKQQNINKIDKLVISHNDADHSGGFLSLLNNFEIRELLLGEQDFIQSKKLSNNLGSNHALSDNSIKIRSCHATKPWHWQNVSFEFIATKKSKSQQNAGNNASCVLLIDTGHNRILVTGDIESKIEKQLVESRFANQLSRVDILVAPHHGSNTSSTQSFVKLTSPKIVLFSAGFANQWHFPRAKVTQRYQQQGSKLLTSFKTGAISFEEDEFGELVVILERQTYSRFWHFNNRNP